MRASRGFTLIELLVVMTIVGVMLGFGIPSFKAFVAQQRVKSASYEISTTLLLARSEAIKRNGVVTIAPASTNAWATGWTVTTVQSGSTLTLQSKDATDNITITKGPSTIVFTGTGRPTASSVSYWEIAGSNATRCVRLDTAGIASTFTGACP